MSRLLLLSALTAGLLTVSLRAQPCLPAGCPAACRGPVSQGLPCCGPTCREAPAPATSAALDTHVRYGTANTPLRDVLRELSAAHRVPVRIDADALARAGVSVVTPVTVRAEGVPLREVLTRVLRPLGLGFTVDSGSVRVTAAASARASDTEAPRTVNYAVADLVIPVGGPVCVDLNRCDAPAAPRPASQKTHERDLIQVIQATVAPGSWEGQGGEGRVRYDAATHSLVVCHRPAVQGQVRELLAGLRRLQDVQVCVEVRFVRIADEFWREHGAGRCLNADSLSDRDLFRLLEGVQADPRSNIQQAPKVTLFNGQRATVRMGDENGSGVQMSLVPTASADRRSVRLEAAVASTCGGVTQGDIAVRAVPAGRTVALGGWVETEEVRSEYGPPVLSRIPYVNRLFKNVGVGRQAYRVVALATPRVIVQEEEEELIQAPAPPKAVRSTGVRGQSPPSPEEVLRALPRAERDNVRVACEKVAESCPQVGASRVLLENWKCTVTSDEVVLHEVPFPFKTRFPRTEVVYIERSRVAEGGGEEASEPVNDRADRAEPGTRVEDLVRQYHAACAAGENTRALRLAREALRLDPACFSKVR